MGALDDLKRDRTAVRELLAARSARTRLDRQLEARAPLPRRRFEIAVFFADGAENLYQLRRWYAPLAELAKTHPVVILSRSPDATSTLLEEAPVPVADVGRVTDLEAFLLDHELPIVLYVNQNDRNLGMMRYGSRWHVFINHGESDALAMTTNQIKAYDYSLVAGDAALARMQRLLWGYDLERRAIPIGRPQNDHCPPGTTLPDDERTVVLYAPTWEGERAHATCSSIVSHGGALVRDLLASPAHRLIYRPHPRSGSVDPAVAAADRAIIAQISAANRDDPAAHHLHDTGRHLGWQVAAADVAVVDVSALVYDRLATGKPLLVTRPVAPDAPVETSGYLSDCEWLTVEQAPAVRARLELLSRDSAAGVRLGRWVEHYFGDTRPGAATRRFHEAIERMLTEWRRAAALHAHDEPVDVRELVPELDDRE